MAECTIYDKLRYIAETKDLIKAAIEAQDVEVLESATFRQYAEYITQIRKVSSVNGMQGDVTITAEGLGALTEIPSEYITETELNEKGYLTAVPDVYITEDELSSQLADKVSQNGLNEAIEGVRNDIPTNVSELTNDSGYITLNEVPKVDLSGYALKSEIPDISVKQDKLTAGNGISITDNVISLDYEYDLFEVVQSLPTENISDNKVYLLLDSNGSEGNTYVEYLYVNGQWEELGKFKVNIDLSGYATEEWVNSQGFLKEHQDISNLATKSELATKQDTISDLETIRSGASKGATALQSVPSEYATEQWVNEQGFLKEHQDISNLATKSELNAKQDVISDLDTIRSGAALGATALQEVPSTYAKKTDILTAKTDERYTDYEVQNPVLSGKTIILQNEVTDSRKYHTFGYEKTYSTTSSNALLNGSTPLYRDSNEYNCPQWDGYSIRFTYQSGNEVYTTLTIPYTYNGIKYVTHLCINVYNDSVRMLAYPYSDDENFPDYQIVTFKDSEIYNSHRSYGTLCIYINGEMQNYDSEPYSPDFFDAYVMPGQEVEIRVLNFPLTTPNGALIIETPRFYLSSNNVLIGDVPTEEETSNAPERLNDYIRYANNVKAYILTDKNTTFKTINGQQITGDGDITIDTNVDLSGYATKSELATKQDVISDLETIRSGAALGATALQSVPDTYATEQWVNEQGFLKEHQDISNLATKEELNAKQDTISDLDTIRSGAALGATALQSVPSEYVTETELNNKGYLTSVPDTYALKSEIPDITTKQDILVSGTNIKTINGTSLLGSGNIEVAANVDLSNLATKEELNAKQDTLVSGTNIKTINGNSLLGSGDITIEGGSGSVDLTDYYTKTETNELVNPKLEQVTLTQAEYDAIQTKEDNVLYIISDAEDLKFKTINGQQITGEGNIEIKASADNVPTVQTTPKGTTNNYIYSTGIFDGYGVISDITNAITYSTDKASIATWKRYWGEESSNSHQSWSINGATTSKAGLMSASDKTKLDGIDITTKQDTLVSGTNIKTVNGISLLGEGNITVSGEGGADLSGYYTKAEIDEMIGGASNTITEINNLVG